MRPFHDFRDRNDDARESEFFKYMASTWGSHYPEFEDDKSGWLRDMRDKGAELGIEPERTEELIEAFQLDRTPRPFIPGIDDFMPELKPKTSTKRRPLITRRTSEMNSRDANQAPVSGSAPRGTLAELQGELERGEILPSKDLLADVIPTPSAGGIISPPKGKKTHFLIDLALSVAMNRGDFLGRELGTGPVFYLALEHSKAEIGQRIQKRLGESAAWPGNFHYRTRGQFPNVPEGGLEALRAECQRIKPALVVIDTLGKFRTTPIGQSLYDADYQSVDQLRALAHECGCAIVFAHHSGKRGRGRDPYADVIATHGFGAGVSFLHELDHKQGAKNGWLLCTGNEIPTQRIPLEWSEQTLRFSRGVSTEGRPDDKLRAAKEWLKERLATGPVRAALLKEWVEEEAIFSWRTLNDAKKKMGIETLGSAKAACWKLP